jgi:Mg-chelatase subunit ChlD
MQPKDRLIVDEDNQDKVVTEVFCVVDRSGSMGSIIDDAVGGYNSFLSDQRKLEDEAYLTLVIFDHEYEVVYERMPMKEVPDATIETFKPRGTTALWDAVGFTLKDAMDRLENYPHDLQVIVVIITDGANNASIEYTPEKVKEMVEQCKTKGWHFSFLAANIDVFDVGNSMGIPMGSSVQYDHSGRGIDTAYAGISSFTSSIRSSGGTSDNVS